MCVCSSICGLLPPVYAHAQQDYSLPSEKQSFSDLDISLERMQISYQAPKEDMGQQELKFNVVIRNKSPHHKVDIDFPLNIVAKDEYGNEYQVRRSSQAIQAELYAAQPMSVYPGEKIGYPCRLQVPVSTAKTIAFDIFDYQMQKIRQVTVQTADIKNWDSYEKKPQFSEDDLIIVFPRDKKIFAPGDKVFLKLGFSKRAGKPDNIYVLLSGYMLTDEDGTGQYELTIPTGSPSGDLEVIVMAEWGTPPQSQVVSKSLFLKVNG